ncbi:hypothetical protein [Opitutus sp. ER46]|uniref:hypothetical protein n=1 Tax=Opitutus sp. ER46 TaxID=2161864 RepID=UPI000D310FC7|nr:hypothetical protein [Opitutus sp. ER46]PTX97914.1 hypothetical protein DB354_06450 [Opitutus sp. ER46]
MLLNSWPIRVLISRAARAYGFLDPVKLVAKIRSFAQPSEFSEPIELLRAGMLFHARGLVNTKAIQNNLDWIWPYWVERQFNPADESFIPRAFSFSHINLTHRNWTAVGLPDVPFYPIVDPRGLVTPLFDGWSLDFWLLPTRQQILAPARLPEFSQQLACDPNLHVRSTARWGDISLEMDVALALHNLEPHCTVSLSPVGLREGFVAVSLRPYNPEGISFVEKVAVSADGGGWIVNGRHPVLFDRRPEQIILSTYTHGDASHRLTEPVPETTVSCSVGMATAVALFRIDGLREHPLEVRTPIYNELEPNKRPVVTRPVSWADARSRFSALRISDPRLQRLYDLAVANLVLHAPREVYPGPYTYKRFWFRDAAFILHAILALGDIERTRRTLALFAPRQRHDGYFLSQEGEWDSNGEAIWIYHRFAQLTGEPLPEPWLNAIEKGARWIIRKRLPADSGLPEAGLLPAGFSAEHLGPNDFYYWDDFWGVAGLRCAADLLRDRAPDTAIEFTRAAANFMATIERSFPQSPHRRFPGAIPASPRRRMDSGAIGSIVADYPLQLFTPRDPRILKTADYLRDHSSFEGGFFQNMIHSGINAYLTLHLAQVRLRAGEVEAAHQLINRVADLASPTGQWPEAIHPRTGGGCMGDGEHIWAAAEWALMLRACFVREEDDGLVVAPGVPPAWWRDEPATFSRTLTRYGEVSVEVAPAAAGRAVVTVKGNWRGAPPHLVIALPGARPQARRAAGPREEFHLEVAP